MSTDPRQRNRLQSLPQMPPLPPVPQLAEQMREGHGLYTPFAKFDQQHQEWARQLGLNLQTAHSSILRVAESKTKAAAQVWPDRGWVRLIRQSDGWWVDGSILYRPDSAKIWIEVLDNRVAGYEATVDLPTFNQSLLKWVRGNDVSGTGFRDSAVLSPSAVGPSQPQKIWVQTGAVPRAFRVTIVSEGTDVNRVGAVPVISLTPGTAVYRDGVKLFDGVTDGVVTVVSRVDDKTYTCWLHSIMDDPVPDSEIHCDACHVTLV